MRLPINWQGQGLSEVLERGPETAQTGSQGQDHGKDHYFIVRVKGNHGRLNEWLPLAAVTARSPAASLFSKWELAVYVPTSPSGLETCCSRDHILVISISSSRCRSYTAQNWHELKV